VSRVVTRMQVDDGVWSNRLVQQANSALYDLDTNAKPFGRALQAVYGLAGGTRLPLYSRLLRVTALLRWFCAWHLASIGLPGYSDEVKS